MPTEIERKFLVRPEAWVKPASGVYCRQGYLHTAEDCTVRVRVADGRGFLTVKGRSRGIVRPEYEYEIPGEDAEAMLDSLAPKPLIEKIRYRIPHGGLIWEVDEFFGDNAGLLLAEVELEREDQLFEKPAWAGEDVSHDPRYYNANLAQNPFIAWK